MSYDLIIKLLPEQLWNTVYMVSLSTIFAVLIGVPLGVVLTITQSGHMKENRFIYKALGAFVNIGRSFPFAIFIVALIPVTRWLLGTSVGTTASIVPLTVAAIPMLARLVEASLRGVDKNLLEASLVMGASPWQVIVKVLLPETLPALIQNITLLIVTLISYSAMAGLVGGGGLGQVAIQYGYQRFLPEVMVATCLLLIGLVQGVQWIGNALVHHITLKRGVQFHDQ